MPTIRGCAGVATPTCLVPAKRASTPEPPAKVSDPAGQTPVYRFPASRKENKQMATKKTFSSKSSSSGSMTPWLGIAAIIILLDQLSKITISKLFVYGEEKVITSFFNLVLAYNKGAAFSFLANEGGWQPTCSPPLASAPPCTSSTCSSATAASACSAGPCP
jgi:hypothetical protein